ncbi:MAG: phage tail tube protein [Georgenia sp.]
MTVLTPASRYFAPGITKVRFIPTVAALTHIPTLVERTAGTLLIDIADISGWDTTSASIGTPDLDNRFTKSIKGRKTASDSSITFWADINGEDVRQVLSEDLDGYVEWADGGDDAGKLADCFPVSVSSVGKVRSVGDQAMQLVVGFTITGVPAVDYPIPTV